MKSSGSRNDAPSGADGIRDIQMLSPEAQTAFAIIGALGGLMGIVGGGFGIAAYFSSGTQTRLMQAEEKRSAEDSEWALRYERLVNQLRHINPRSQVQDFPAQAVIPVYATIFPDPKFRSDLRAWSDPAVILSGEVMQTSRKRSHAGLHENCFQSLAAQKPAFFPRKVARP